MENKQSPKCPECKAEIQHIPKKNIAFCSMIETTTQTQMCVSDSRPLEILCPKTERFICAQCYFDVNPEIITRQSVDVKINKIQEKRPEINRKRQLAYDDLNEYLSEANKDAYQAIDETADREMAKILSIRKQQKKEADCLYYSQKERLEHELLAQGLMKYQQESQQKLDNWTENQQGRVATEIMEINLDTTNYMEDLNKNIEEFKRDSGAKHERFISSVKNKSLFTETSGSYVQCERNYLQRTFEEYAISATRQEENDWFELRQKKTEPMLISFYPEYFTCSLQKLNLKLHKTQSLDFRIIGAILPNIASLSDLKLYFKHRASSNELETLANCIGQLKNLQKLSLDLHADFDQNTYQNFLKFFENLLKSKQGYHLDLACDSQHLNIEFEERENSTKECSLSLKGKDDKLYRPLLVLFTYPHRSICPTSFKFCFEKGVTNDETFNREFIQALEKSTKLRQLDLQFARPVYDELLRQTFRAIMSLRQLEKLSLLFTGDYFPAPFWERQESTKLDELFEEFRSQTYENHKLNEFTLTILNCLNRIKFESLPTSLRNFTQLEGLRFRLFQVKTTATQIKEFCKKIEKIKSLKTFELGLLNSGNLDKKSQPLFRSFLPYFLNQRKVIFGKLSSEKIYQDLSQYEAHLNHLLLEPDDMEIENSSEGNSDNESDSSD